MIRANPFQKVPDYLGDVFGVCDTGSRWHRYAFGRRDEGLLVKVTTGESGVSAYTLRIGGKQYGEVTEWNGKTHPQAENRSFRICKVLEERIGGAVTMSPAGGTCGSGNWVLPNPEIKMTVHDDTVSQWVLKANIQLAQAKFNPDVYFMTSMSHRCYNNIVDGLAYFRVGGVYHRFDPRLKLALNTIDQPATGSIPSSVDCPSVSQNFVNEMGCVRRGSCNTVTFTSKSVALDNDNLRFWYTANQRFVYYILGLRLEPPFNVSPCSGFSRWLRWNNGTCVETSLDSQTRTKFRAALSASTDTNTYVRDINLDGASCTANAASVGAVVKTGGECFQHVHPHLYDVRDATYWAGPSAHPGNPVAAMGGRPNPIKQFAKQGDSYLTYPSWHGMERWGDRNSELAKVGRFGDAVDFRALSTELQTMEMALRVGAVNQGTSDTSALTCGSRGESANVPALGNFYQLQNLKQSNSLRQKYLDLDYVVFAGKSMLWQNVALTAPDQLRHRVAWALAQIFTIAQEGLGRPAESEVWGSYYDIFVKHAFGNYRDIMREVSYSPMMADYLSFRGNQALAFSGNYPDENYAREIMQLFSVGLWKLRRDGSRILDSNGNPIDTYTNEDIVDFARLWTGFDRQQPRGNTERPGGPGSGNQLDAMQIKPKWRDALPKAKLDTGYLGDEYPLCDELPERHWLKRGAMFVYTGETSVEGPVMDSEATATSGKHGRFTAVPGSDLYNRLCAKNAAGICTFPARVTLGSNIRCSSLTGQDCVADAVKTVKVVDTTGGVTRYFTYVPTPCVRLAFFAEGRSVSAGWAGKQCAPKSAAIAPAVCCEAARPHRPVNSVPGLCAFANEDVTFDTAKKRCEAAGHVVCSPAYVGASNWDRSCAASRFTWMDEPCNVKIQVYGSGRVGIIDQADSRFSLFKENSFSNFRVRWNKGTFPKAPNCGSTCTVVTSSQGDTCVCDFTFQQYAVFTDESVLPTRVAVQNQLHQGAPDPRIFGAGVYTRCTTGACASRTDVRVWTRGASSQWDQNTIFEMAPFRLGGRRRYLFNRRSNIRIGSHVFRNPPAFMPLVGEQSLHYVEWTSDNLALARAEQEVEALLDHLFEHQNTAPFVAYRLIQRLVTSNPSPRFMNSVTAAFLNGKHGSKTYSGKYGDLLATVNAILLDPEARSNTIESDPSYGLLREPLLKVMSVFRSLQYEKRVPDSEVMIFDLTNKIGMEPFMQPSVFGFYLPEHRPDGDISDLGLVAPEVEIATGPLFVGYLNGVSSLVDYGLTNCDGGFGQYIHPNGRKCGNRLTPDHVDGALAYTPVASTPEGIVDEFALLLTADRMTPETRALLVSEYNAAGAPAAAMKRILKLFLMTAEFHVTNANILKSTIRAAPAPITGMGRKYKAIVVVFEAGGADSFNLVVPHSGCSNGDFYAQYSSIRQGAAVAKNELLSINVANQVCSTFGVHPSFSNLRSLYSQNQAAFFSNIGALVEPLTPADYKGTSGQFKRFPPSLFAHNVMQRSMHNLDPQNTGAKGILGRIVNALRTRTTNPFSSALYSLIGNVKMVEGSIPPFFVDKSSGVARFKQYRQLENALKRMTMFEGNSAFAETYNRILNQTLEQSEAIGSLLDAISLSTTFGTDSVSQQLQQVAKIIKMRSSSNSERDVFIINRGGETLLTSSFVLICFLFCFLFFE